MNKKMLVAAALLFFGFKKMNDVLSDVGATIEEVKTETVQQITAREFNVPYYTREIKAACSKLPVGVREMTMMSLGKIIRGYVESDEFKTEYLAYVDSHFPHVAFNPDDEKWVSERKQKTDDLAKSMEDPATVALLIQNLDIDIQGSQSMLDMIKQADTPMPGVNKEYYETTLKNAKMLKELAGKDREAFKKKYVEVRVASEMKSEMDQEKKALSDNVEKYEQLKDYKSIIRQELRQFLSTCEDIDFKAQLIKKGNVMVFANPAYEQKPDEWKFCFRCGKEAVSGAEKFARAWLNDLR